MEESTEGKGGVLMSTETLRRKFAEYLKANKLDNMLTISSSATLIPDYTLKYERIDKYSVVVLSGEELKRLNTFCKLHNIALWIGADKLCIGYNYKGNMRLSAYANSKSV